MKIPAFWSRASVEDTASDGRQLSATSWRWSDTSEQDAHQSAIEAARRTLDRLIRGEQPNVYGYADRPLREEVIEQFLDTDGKLFAALTRNRYGAVVLNAASAMFIDLDFPTVSTKDRLTSFFSRLFKPKTPTIEAMHEQQIWDRLQEFISERRGWSFRVYRTFAGVRALATHALFDPSSPETLALMSELGADPLYIQLCKSQDCFRARLTPKPWRCGQHSNPVEWPWKDGGEEDRFQQWNVNYEQAQNDYATCRLIGTLGMEQIHTDLRQVVKIHDQFSGCDRSLPLA